MILLLVLGLWAVASVTLTLMWIGYRQFVGTYSMDDIKQQQIDGNWSEVIRR